MEPPNGATATAGAGGMAMVLPAALAAAAAADVPAAPLTPNGSGRPLPPMPDGLAWIERGSALIRRMNSERIAEDPRIKRLLFPAGSAKAPQSPRQDPPKEGADAASDTPNSNGSNESARDSFEHVEVLSDDEAKQGQENNAPNTYRLVLWTYRLHASIQSSLQYTPFAKASEDGFFIPISPRVFCVAPAYMNVFFRLFGIHSTVKNWRDAVRQLKQLDSIISKRFAGGACVFDCGLFDGIKRLHHKPFVYDEFCDGKIASISYSRATVPPMHSAFVIASTVAAWLEWKPANVAILMAPTNDQLSLFATCCAIYNANTSSLPENFGNDLLDVYQQHIRGSESWPTKLHRTFSGLEPKNMYYCGSVPRPLGRYIADFQKLLDMRDQKLVEHVDGPAIEARKHKLNGVTVTPAAEQLYIHQILLLHCGGVAGLSEQSTIISDTYRPYFVLQSEKGVLFSSMVNGVRNCSMSNGPHVFKVGKTLQACSDVTLRMYHLPFGRQGELLFDCRLHATILLEVIGAAGESKGGLEANDVGEITLRLSDGDFDCVSATHNIPKDFAIQVVYARSQSAFPPTLAAMSLSDAPPASTSSHVSGAASPPSSTSSFDGLAPPRSRRSSGAKNAVYNGTPVVTYLVNQRGIRTTFGDATLDKIDVIRKVQRSHLDIYLLFHVNIGDGVMKILPYRHLFRYILPDEVRMKMIEMGANEESVHETAPFFFDAGGGMTFDEEYARWLQHMYDTDLSNPENNYDGEFLRGIAIAQAQVPVDYRSVSMPTTAPSQEATSPPFRPTRGPLRMRGASSLLIHQLPTYIYSGTRTEQADHHSPDCLVCRSSFEDGDEVKSLPCFHSYHSDCIDSWLQLNKVCPVCQHSIDMQLSVAG
ncbi:TPA: hypothetical protein N0F65_012316 [Lagenidium giganteum]|uniref:RING-type domain-containing protein n=1 Tax=Lagenidium giganteum TaxID=4803 RepID=A0AAV2YU21_9STRA|nr:TPA: hypothetical protein N0F65_012316 [Lagenidium giganteum]